MKNNNKTLITICIILIIIMILGVFAYLKLMPVKENNDIPVDNHQNTGQEKVETFNYNSLEVESGFKEIVLSNSDKENIYIDINTHLNPTSELGFLGSKLQNGTLQKNVNIFKDDCDKVDFTFWYLNLNNQKGYDISKDIIQDNEYEDRRKVKYTKVIEITKEMFNINSINCPKDEYLMLSPGGGGAVAIATQVLKKYQKDNIYYLILYFTDNTECIKEFMNSSYNYKECININSNLTYNTISKFMKLKYGVKDNGEKYLISLEALN